MSDARLRSFRLCLIWLVAIGLVSCRNSSAPVRDTKKRIQKKIVGGKDAPVGRFPYMCSLRLRGSREHKCGGMVIHPRWVLTAAHCVDPNLDESVGLQPVIYCGIHEIDDDSPEMTFTAIDSVLHPLWNRKVKKGFDIAMLKLDRKSHSPIPEILAKENLLSSGSRLTALGWGKAENSQYSEKLRVTDNLAFVPPNICRNSGYYVDAERMVCAGLSHENTCEGDSGGPLLLPDAPKGELKIGRPNLDLLVGITSYSLGSCTDKSSTLGIYTRVGYYSEWIQSVISNVVVKKDKETSDKTRNDDALTAAAAPEDGDPAPLSALEIDFADDFDSLVQSYSEPADTELPEGPSSSPTGSTEPPQPDTCATSPEAENVLDAIQDDDATFLRAVLDCGLDPDTKYNDTALLHWAARYDSSDTAQVLVDSGADVNAKDYLVFRPLHYCGEYGSVSVAKVLIDNGADVNAKGFYLFTPLHSAASEGFVEVVKLLLDSGADVEATMFHSSRTPLHLAAQSGYADVAKILLENNADVNAADFYGETPLVRAAYEGHLDVVELLLENGADVNASKPNGLTALQIASYGGDNPKVVEALLEGGAWIGARDENGTTALHYACGRGHNSVVKTLIKEGADVGAKDDFGHTPLHMAANQGYAYSAKILVDADADVDATDGIGEAPLHEAAEYGYLDVVEVLVEAGASKTIRDENGDRPEDVVCRRADPECNLATRLALEDLLES